MAFYPKPIESKPAEVLDYKVEAPKIIALLESGCPEGYVVNDIAVGEDLTKPHVTALVLAGRDCAEQMSGIYDQVLLERARMAAVKVTKTTTQVAYTAELDAVSEVAEGAKWIAGLKAVHDVTTWTALRDKIAVEDAKPVEEVVEEKP